MLLEIGGFFISIRRVIQFEPKYVIDEWVKRSFETALDVLGFVCDRFQKRNGLGHGYDDHAKEECKHCAK